MESGYLPVDEGGAQRWVEKIVAQGLPNCSRRKRNGDGSAPAQLACGSRNWSSSRIHSKSRHLRIQSDARSAELGTGVPYSEWAEWAVRVARQVRHPESDLYQLEIRRLAADIGKIGVPDSILKQGRKLTDAKRALMKQNIRNTAGPSLRCFRDLRKGPVSTLHHHESFTEQLPAGLKGRRRYESEFGHCGGHRCI